MIARVTAYKDDALVKLMLRGDRLYSPNPSVEQKIEAGQIGNNQRLELFAFLVDVAGNLGGATAVFAEAADWRSIHGTDGVLAQDTDAPTVPASALAPTNVPIIGDATAPVITINYPNPDSIEAGSHRARISNRAITFFSNYTPLPEEPAKTWLLTNPLSFDLSEVPDSIKIVHGDSTFSLGSGAVDNPDTPFDEDRPPTGF